MSNIVYRNRGMFLEKLLNDTNTYYVSIDKAIIYKKPTPIKVLEVSYPTRRTTVINKAVYERISTLDYNGIYKGKYIEFDAKECKNKNSFPLSNIKEHQIEHIKRIIKHGGIAFIILFMNNEFYLIDGNYLINYIKNNTKKSISYEEIKNNTYKINETYIPRIDYLKVVDKVYFGGNNEENKF
jgi:recombination protein U